MLRVLGNVILGVLVLMLAYVAFVTARRLVPTTAARQAAMTTVTSRRTRPLTPEGVSGEEPECGVESMTPPAARTPPAAAIRPVIIIKASNGDYRPALSKSCEG